MKDMLYNPPFWIILFLLGMLLAMCSCSGPPKRSLNLEWGSHNVRCEGKNRAMLPHSRQLTPQEVNRERAYWQPREY